MLTPRNKLGKDNRLRQSHNQKKLTSKIQTPSLGTLSSRFFKSSLSKSTPRDNEESRFPLQVFL